MVKYRCLGNLPKQTVHCYWELYTITSTNLTEKITCGTNSLNNEQLKEIFENQTISFRR